MSTKAIKLTSSKKLPLALQKKVELQAKNNRRQVVIVRTLFGTFTGCIVDVLRGAILLRVFSGFNRTFITIRIPVSIIFDIFPFKCK